MFLTCFFKKKDTEHQLHYISLLNYILKNSSPYQIHREERALYKIKTNFDLMSPTLIYHENVNEDFFQNLYLFIRKHPLAILCMLDNTPHVSVTMNGFLCFMRVRLSSSGVQVCLPVKTSRAWSRGAVHTCLQFWRLS